MRERSSAPAPLPLAALAAGLAAVACAPSGHHGPGPSPGPPPPPVFPEREPNDQAGTADDFGLLHAGAHFVIEGHVQAFGPDVLDGFRFVAAEPLWVDFVLEGLGSHADPDLCVYDPWLDAYVACYDGPGRFEEGTVEVFAAGTEFHLVVEAFGADTPYLLELRTGPLGHAPAASAGASGPSAAPGPLAALGGEAGATAREGSRRDAYRPRAAAPPARPAARGRWIEIAADGSVRSLHWELRPGEARDR